jgi:hypothetical protein
MEDCSYNCKKFPDEVEPYGDISGLGVRCHYAKALFTGIV